MRPDQLLKKRRDDEAAKRIAETNRPKKFTRIVLLGDRKPKKHRGRKRFCYCYVCLRKYRFKSNQQETTCIDCDVELREVKSLKALAGVVTRLKIYRGLRDAGSKANDYDAYLRSKVWRIIRERIMERDGRKCRDCGCKAQHVHHLSYSGRVMLGLDDSQLLALCVTCHAERHPDKPRMAR